MRRSGRPPLVVNSSTKVANLNADKLDELDSTALQRKLGSCGNPLSGLERRGDVSGHAYLEHPYDGRLRAGASVHDLLYVARYPVLVFLSGSGWRTPAQGPGYIEIDAVIDGYSIAQARVFTNETSSHKALVAAMGVVTFPAGTHQLSVQLVQGTVDGSDEFRLSLL
jgi:hypothetical protein